MSIKVEIDDEHNEILQMIWEKYGADYSYQEFVNGFINAVFYFYCDLFIGDDLPEIPDDFFNFGKPN